MHLQHYSQEMFLPHSVELGTLFKIHVPNSNACNIAVYFFSIALAQCISSLHDKNMKRLNLGKIAQNAYVSLI